MRTGRMPTPVSRARGPRRVAWSRHISNGIWNGHYARCRWLIVLGRTDPVIRRRTYRPPSPHPSGVTPPALPAEVTPKHVAIIMDGNGRWAKERGLPRTSGHSAGEAALFDVIEGALELG